MHRYKPLSNTIEVPYVPENFISILAEIAEEGYLFPERAPLQAQVERQSLDYVRVRILDRNHVLVLRFDTLEVWRDNDHTVRYQVSYCGRDHKAPWAQHLLTSGKYVLVIFLSLLFRISVFELARIFHLTHEEADVDSGENARPLLRPIGKRLKEIASVMPA